MNTLSVFSEWTPKSLGWPPKPSHLWPCSFWLTDNRPLRAPRLHSSISAVLTLFSCPKGLPCPLHPKSRARSSSHAAPAQEAFALTSQRGGTSYSPPPTPNHVSQRRDRTAASYPIYFWSWCPRGEGNREVETNSLALSKPGSFSHLQFPHASYVVNAGRTWRGCRGEQRGWFT